MDLLDAIVRHKRAELEERRSAVPQATLEARCRALPPPRDLEQALRPRAGGVRLIAEVKKASPSRGVLTEVLDPVGLARQYARHGADAISVLTDAKYFQGSLEALTTIRGSVDVPLLRKDFTLDEYQLWEARAAGADAVLLIVAILEPAQLRALLRSAAGLGLAALVECHTAAEVAAALGAGARLVGINNRDLHTFDTRLETTLELRPLIPPGPIVVSESGFFTGADVRRVVAAGVHAVLVGEALVRAPDVGAKIAELTLREPASDAAEPTAGRPRGAGAPAANADG
jgi:indole-3-glycerol phosphate synthase